MLVALPGQTHLFVNDDVESDLGKLGQWYLTNVCRMEFPTVIN